MTLGERRVLLSPFSLGECGDFLECGAFPPLFFFRVSANDKPKKAAEKRRTPNKGKALE